MTGVEYPTITVGKHEGLTVRYSMGAQVLALRRGLDPVMKVISDKERHMWIEAKQGPQDAVRNVMTAFSCMVVDNFTAGLPPHKLDFDLAPTADYWFTQMTDFKEIELVVWKALVKAAEEQKKTLAAAPPLAIAS